MTTLQTQAPAKLNLSLDVLGRRPDGYHDLKMVMISVSLYDRITLTVGTGKGLRISTNLGFLPTNERNLAAMAALKFQEKTGIDLGGVDLALDKRIPVCAGTGGGSADAAAVLRVLNAHFGAPLSPEALVELGSQVGSDVPYCILGGTALAEGIGERLTPLPPLPPCYLVLCKPTFSASTPELFKAIDSVKLRHRPDTAGLLAALAVGDLVGVARRLYNVFEDVVQPRTRKQVEEIKSILIGNGALGACMTGTGSTVFGLFCDENAAIEAKNELARGYKDVFLCQPV